MGEGLQFPCMAVLPVSYVRFIRGKSRVAHELMHSARTQAAEQLSQAFHIQSAAVLKPQKA